MDFRTKRILFLSVMFLVTGCAKQYVPLWEAEQNNFHSGVDSLEEIRDSIVEGATSAGWTVNEISEHRVRITRKIRVHTVTVDVQYSGKQFMPRYVSSIGMKMRCTQSEVDNNRHRVSGLEECPGGRAPYYIHSNYKVWLDELAAEIEKSLAARNLNANMPTCVSTIS